MSESVGATFTLTEASKQCRRENGSGQWSSVSRKTLQRALDSDEFPSGFRADGPAGEGSGPWMIPKDGLIGAGFIPGGGRAEIEREEEPEHITELRERSLGGPRSDEAKGLRDQLAKAEADAAEYRRRAEVAEAIAEERGPPSKTPVWLCELSPREQAEKLPLRCRLLRPQHLPRVTTLEHSRTGSNGSTEADRRSYRGHGNCRWPDVRFVLRNPRTPRIFPLEVPADECETASVRTSGNLR